MKLEDKEDSEAERISKCYHLKKVKQDNATYVESNKCRNSSVFRIIITMIRMMIVMMMMIVITKKKLLR